MEMLVISKIWIRKLALEKLSNWNLSDDKEVEQEKSLSHLMGGLNLDCKINIAKLKNKKYQIWVLIHNSPPTAIFERLKKL